MSDFDLEGTSQLPLIVGIHAESAAQLQFSGSGGLDIARVDAQGNVFIFATDDELSAFIDAVPEAKGYAMLLREIIRLRGSVECLRQYASDTFRYWDSDQDMKVGKRLQAMGGMLPIYDATVTAALESAKNPNS